MPNMVVKQNNMVTDSSPSNTHYQTKPLEVVKPHSGSPYSASNPYKYTPSSGSSSRSGRSGGGSSSGSGAVAAGGGDTYWDASSVWSDYLNKMMAAADATYSSNMNSIANAYNASRNALNTNHDMTMNRLVSEYVRSQRAIGRDADNTQR